MSEFDTERLDRLFRAALEQPVPERRRWAAEQCADDSALQTRLARMIDAASSEEDPALRYFDRVRDRLLGTLFGISDDAKEDLSGQRVSCWRIDEPLARGGLATVYRAHRDDGQYARRAAFKVLRRGLDTDDIITRFRAERQILSSLQHPAIARLLDGGALADGRPYLVLEYVDGQPITDYCATRNLDLERRLRLVIEVLDALQDAHRHLVIHRDIKPSNILVSEDGRLTLLDFGIAKLLDRTLIPADSIRTRTGVMMMTPGYASPEQRSGEAVTTASDLYQVGAVLYELLTGQRPQLTTGAPGEDTCPAPSRNVCNALRAGAIRGDLDAIVGKAMHADPTHRYASAGEMAADLERFLVGRPVLARPDSYAYRLAKLHRRKPWLLPALALGAAALSVYIYTLQVYNRQVRLEQQRAIAASNFMKDLIGSPNPYFPADPERGQNISIADALEAGLHRLRSAEYGDDDILRANLLVSISEVFASIDAETFASVEQHPKAVIVREEALALERRLYGDVSEPVIRSLRALANQFRTIGKYDLAEPLFAEQLASARAYYPANDPEVGVAELASGRYRHRVGNNEEGMRLAEAAIDKLRQAPQTHAYELINAIVLLARIRGVERPQETLVMLEQARELAITEFGPEQTQTALVLTQTAQTLSMLGQHAQAELYFDEAIAKYEARLGRSHGATLIALTGLAQNHLAAGDPATAETLFAEVLAHYLAKYGSRHRGVAANYHNLAAAIAAQGRYAEAIPMYRSAFESELAVLRDDNPDSYRFLLPLAYAQLRAGDATTAAATAAEVSRHLARIGAATPLQGWSWCLEGLALAAQGLAAESHERLERARQLLRFHDPSMPFSQDCH